MEPTSLRGTLRCMSVCVCVLYAVLHEFVKLDVHVHVHVMLVHMYCCMVLHINQIYGVHVLANVNQPKCVSSV